MGSTRSKGTLKKWFDDKGFGFIATKKDAKDVFIHISAFDRNIPRIPKIGDTIFYHITTDKNGKPKAVDAIIEGASPRKKAITPRPKKYYKKSSSKNSWKLFVISIALAIGAGATIYDRLQTGGGHKIVSNTQRSAAYQTSQYTCGGKTHCSQMTTCEEAQFYIRNCPGTQMDGDGDGIPCERQLCN